MEFIPIPLAALESPKYMELSSGDKQFLVDLYVLFHDTERFTIDMAHPENYRQPAGATLARKIRSLLDADLLTIVATKRTPHGNDQRIFSFTYPALEAIAA